MIFPTPVSAPRLILASASPRRQSLLREAGYDFLIEPADINEEIYAKNVLPADLARWLAMDKAQAVAARFPEDIVLGADTVVAFGDMALGKPADPAEARDMLTLLAGTTHLVITGVAVVHRAAKLSRGTRVMSAVRMRSLTPGEIENYVAGDQWRGKAGGYGIQDADPFVKKMTGSRSNIVGLPMNQTRELLAAAGVHPSVPK